MVWDRNTGQPLYNAIVWLDNRTADVCHKMAEQLGSRDYFRPGRVWCAGSGSCLLFWYEEVLKGCCE